MKLNTVELAWGKMNGLLPAIIQDAKTKTILMVGYMNQNALQKTMETKWVTFYSRSKNKLWVKGETSGNKLEFIDIFSDCDHDALLIFANPTGPICHQGTQSCFGKTSLNDWEFILNLEKIILDRQKIRSEKSYTSSLFDAGISRIAQKVGEEGIEVVLAAIEKNDAEFCGEIADLLFHVLVLLRARNLNLSNVVKILKSRHDGF